MAPPSRVHVLVVDDDPEMARHVGLLARMTFAGWAVTPVHSGAAALAAIQEHDPSVARLLVVTDFNLGAGANGVEVLRAAQARDPEARLILMSGEHPSALEGALEGARPHAFIEKPFTVAAMQASLRAAAVEG